MMLRTYPENPQNIFKISETFHIYLKTIPYLTEEQGGLLEHVIMRATAIAMTGIPKIMLSTNLILL